MSTHDSDRFDGLLRIEPLLLFLVFYLPGYLAQSQQLSGRVFNDVGFNLTYLLVALPRIALLIYLISLRERLTGRSESAWSSMAEYGIVRLRMLDLAWAAMVFVAIEVVILPLTLLGGLLVKEGFTANPVHWRLTNPMIVPLVFLTSLSAGYSEELYFRSYLLTMLPRLGLAQGGAIAASTVLFAAGHLYEGALGVAGTLAIGAILALVFLKRRNLHVVAIAHGAYNFLTLLATLPQAGMHLFG